MPSGSCCWAQAGVEGDRARQTTAKPEAAEMEALRREAMGKGRMGLRGRIRRVAR